MKIAVLGSGSHALDVVEYLENIGAHVKWYATDCEHQKAINKNVIRVHKRFVDINEDAGSSRLYDLFRVVFEQNPEKEISTQMKGDNAGIFEKLTPFEMDYLKSRFESFEDFDLIVHLPNKKSFYRFSGPSGVAAIGEQQINGIDYDHGQWSFAEQARDIAIIGEQASSHENLAYLSKWLIEGEGHRRVFYITDEVNPLSDKSFEQSLSLLDKYEQQRAEVFLDKLRKWQTLEDYEKAKIARPQDPIPLLVFFAGHNITAMSKLSDQEKIYLTCEVPEWREVKKGEDNARQPLKTIAVDKLIVANGHQHHSDIFQQMKKVIHHSSQLDDNLYEPGLLQFDLDESGTFLNLEAKVIIDELDKVIRNYFMESE